MDRPAENAAQARPWRAPTRVVEPHCIKVPEPLSAEIDDLVERVSRRTGESPADVRRGVEVSLIQRGIRAMQNEEGCR